MNSGEYSTEKVDATEWNTELTASQPSMHTLQHLNRETSGILGLIEFLAMKMSAVWDQIKSSPSTHAGLAKVLYTCIYLKPIVPLGDKMDFGKVPRLRKTVTPRYC